MRAAAAALVLRDVHVPPQPGWWPPAPGWWALLALVVLALAIPAWWSWRRRRQRQAWGALFEAESRRGGPADQLAAISALLRRAARGVDPQADRLEGEAWLSWLDGEGGKAHVFAQGPGRALLEGPYRPDVAAEAVEALRGPARARFVQLMEDRR